MSNSIVVVQGDSALLNVHVEDSTGADFNLTGATDIIFSIKESFDDTTYLLQKDLAMGITVTNAVGGLFSVKIEDGDTTDFPGVKPYDIQVEIGGDVFTVVRDTISIEREVTV